jgi:hypothetical protein
MAVVNSSSLENYIKEKYADEADDTIVKCSILVKDTQLNKNWFGVGDKFQIPVKVQDEQGWTFGVPTSVSQANGPIPLQIEPAQVPVPMLSLQSAINVDVLKRTGNGKEASFGPALDLMLDSARDSLYRLAEVEYLYGGDSKGWAIVNGSPSVSGTTATITLKSYAPAWFASLVGAQLDFYNAAGTTHRNTNAAVVITGFNLTTNVLSVSGNNTDLSAIASTDIVVGFGEGTLPSSSFAGIVGLMTQTSYSGNWGWGIDNTVFPSVAGQVLAVNGVFTYAEAAKMVGLSTNFLPESDLSMFCSPNQYAALIKEQVGATTSATFGKRYMDGDKEAEAGFTGMEIPIGDTRCMIRRHPFVKDIDALLLPLDECDVAGTSKGVFDATAAGNMFVFTPATLSYNYSLVFQAQPVILKPNQCVRATGLTVAA